MIKFNRLTRTWQDKSKLIVVMAIALYILIFSSLSLWKYFNFAYNAMDLAIINQAFYNSSFGNFFSSSIQPPSYLGDHFTPILFLLLPIYTCFRHPLTLLVLQTIILALSAWPLYLIAKKILNQSWATNISLAWLINPFVQNINLFEFHLLPFAVFFIFWTFYFYQANRFRPFIIFTILALLVREDVSLVIAMFGLLALLDRKKIKWWLTPILLSVIYFGLSLKITGLFNDAGSYKFLVYYSWLGANPLELLKNAVIKPWRLITHILRPTTLEFLLGIMLPAAFLPVLKPKHLILGLGIFSQLILGSAGVSALLLQTHYCALMLPALFISLIYGLSYVINESEPVKETVVRLIRQEKKLAGLIFFITLVYTSLTLGPLTGSINQLYTQGLVWPATKASQPVLKMIPPQAKVAATYDFLANLSSRPGIYSFNYAFLGKKQFLVKDYNLPPETEYIILDYQSLISYQLQYQQNPFYRQQYQVALNHWSKTLDGFGLIALDGTTALYKKGAENKFKLIEVLTEAPKIDFPLNDSLAGQLKFLGYNQPEEKHYQFFWQVKQNINSHYQLLITWRQNDKIIGQKIYPLAYDILPTNQWSSGQIIQTDYWFATNKKLPAGNYDLTLELIEITKGGLDIDGIRSATNSVDEFERLADPIAIGQISI